MSYPIEGVTIPAADASTDGNIISSNEQFRRLNGANEANIWDMLGVEVPGSGAIRYHRFIVLVDCWGDIVNAHAFAKLSDTNNTWRLIITPPPVWTGRAPDETDEGYQIPITGLKVQYEKKMCHNTASLFKTFRTYVDHLPCRQRSDGKWQRLCGSPYYARSEDLTEMTKLLGAPMNTTRPSVKYAVSPSGTGKTSSIAAAFVECIKSGQLSHYIYLAFRNNKNYNFSTTGVVASDTSVAERQGGEFMLTCLEKLLSAERVKQEIAIARVPRTDDIITAAGNSLLDDQMSEPGRILVHLDEYRKMCDNPNFRRGAISMLARLPRVVVVATYTEYLDEIPSDESSQVCRLPIPIPVLDVRALMNDVPQLRFQADPSNFDGAIQRLWANMLFRLGLFMSTAIPFLHLREHQEMEDFLTNFHKQVKQLGTGEQHSSEVVSKVLNQCIALCNKRQACSSRLPRGFPAYQLLLGVDEDNLLKVEGRIGHGLVTIPGCVTGGARQFTATLDALVTHDILAGDDAVKDVCWQGAQHFRPQLNSSKLLSDSPLECAYVWTIATRSCHTGKLQFVGEGFFEITAKSIKGSRIFDNNDLKSFNLSAVNNLELNTIYYAKEKKGQKSTHPCGDIFFRTVNNEVVLIDVTGSPKSSVLQKKEKRLLEWIKLAEEQAQKDGSFFMSFHGVVLAPLATTDPRRGNDQNCQFSVGTDARRLLGGLAQCMAWYS